MRRIVTYKKNGDEDGILFDDSPANWQEFGLTRACDFWVTGATPPSINERCDAAAGEWHLDPPVGGTALRVSVHQPGEVVPEHATDTLDYVIVVAGEMTLLLGQTEVTLRPGDTVIQQGTRHGWANRAQEPCTLVAAVLSAKQ